MTDSLALALLCAGYYYIFKPRGGPRPTVYFETKVRANDPFRLDEINQENIMKIWFWVMLSILMLAVGCASSYSTRPRYHEGISAYWSTILYNQIPESEQR